jgi:hypothetical protein
VNVSEVNREYLKRHRARFRTNEDENQELGLGRKIALKGGAFLEMEEDEWGPAAQDLEVQEMLRSLGKTQE